MLKKWPNNIIYQNRIYIIHYHFASRTSCRTNKVPQPQQACLVEQRPHWNGWDNILRGCPRFVKVQWTSVAEISCSNQASLSSRTEEAPLKWMSQYLKRLPPLREAPLSLWHEIYISGDNTNQFLMQHAFAVKTTLQHFTANKRIHP